MQVTKTVLIFATLVLLVSSSVEAKKRRKPANVSKTKTKTKWSTSTENGEGGAKAIVATEEHGYYVKRTFLPLNGSSGEAATRTSPPYLAIPVAWFSCSGDCSKANSGAINGAANALADGFLCDDDCSDPYEPICGRTPSEVAVFYNRCKLNVAKCRSHGLWTDLPYEECKTTYPHEVAYTDKKFRSSPYFNGPSKASSAKPDDPQENKIMLSALEALNEIGERLGEAQEATDSEYAADSTTVITTDVDSLTTI